MWKLVKQNLSPFLRDFGFKFTKDDSNGGFLNDAFERREYIGIRLTFAVRMIPSASCRFNLIHKVKSHFAESMSYDSELNDRVML